MLLTLKASAQLGGGNQLFHKMSQLALEVNPRLGRRLEELHRRMTRT